MDEPYMGEIRPISFSYAPRGWAFCNGQPMSIAQNSALFSLLGTQFGGDGKVTFNLPDLRGRVPMGTGQLPGGSGYVQGVPGGAEGVSLQQSQIPNHAHTYTGSLQTSNSADQLSPKDNLPALGGFNQYVGGAVNVKMSAIVAGDTTPAGASQAHENRQPFVVLNYVICIQGLYPSRQ